MALKSYTLHALTPTLSRGRGSKSPIPLLPREKDVSNKETEKIKKGKSPIPLLLREKGLGDEGVQGVDY